MDPREDYDDRPGHVPYWVPSPAMWFIVAPVVLSAVVCAFLVCVLTAARFGP